MATRLPSPTKLTPDELVERWTLWLRNTQDEAFHLYASRYTWENIQRMFAANTELQQSGGHIYEWMHRNFWTEHAMAIRKEMECGKGYLTLMNFLDELKDYSEAVLTRKRYVSLYKNERLVELGIADRDFDGLNGAMCHYPRQSSHTDCISADSIRRARKWLEHANANVVLFSHLFVAHRTNADPMTLTLADLYRAVNRIFDTYAIYYQIITGATWAGRYPTPQYDWFKPFTFAWLADDFKEFEPPR